MINIFLRNIFFGLLILISINTVCYSKINSEIIFKINDKIITNIDLENEKKFLLFLNPNLNNLKEKQIDNISKNSLKNRIIKEIELKKFFELDNDDIGNTYIDNFIFNSGYETKDNLIAQLNKFNIELKSFEKNFLIDNLWREFIFNKFKTKVKIDIQKLRKDIQNQDRQIEEINLSEILFKIKPNLTFDELKNQIYSEISKSGFEAAASMFSISDSKNFGGNLGWIKSSQISEKIYAQIKNKNGLSKPIKTNNGYLIIKINSRRNVNETIEIEEELKKLVKIETEKELNKLGYIYFNKLKKKTFISEN